MNVVTWSIVCAVSLLAVLFLLHVRLYYKDADMLIIQTSLASLGEMVASDSDVAWDLLRERRPIVLEDRLVDPHRDISASILGWQYVWKSGRETTASGDKGMTRTRERFTALYFVPTDSVDDSDDYYTVYVSSPSDPTSVVAIRLLPGRVLILPPRWSYGTGTMTSSHSSPLMRTRFHDTTSLILSTFPSPP
jgi:hypothetical protein